MKIIYLLILFLFSCAPAKISLITVCNEPEMESWYKNCISQTEKSNSDSEKQYYYKYCQQEAHKLFCRQDTTVSKGKKIYLCNEAPKKLKKYCHEYKKAQQKTEKK